MANYTKSFNFRNGVQVDDSNFIVNSVGLVGIGTTIPEKRLDVRGNASITGITSLSGAVVSGVITAGNIKVDSVSGIVTATKFVGDASGLTNIVAIATDGFIANAGGLSTTTNIGIGSEVPTVQLDVLGNSIFTGVTTFIGITSSIGTLFVNQFAASGISTFDGNIDANKHTVLNTLVVGGITTFTGSIDANGGASIDNINIGITGNNEIDTSSGDLTIDSATGQTVIDDNLIVSGIVSATQYSGASSSSVNVQNGVNISGVSTFSDNVIVGTSATVGVGSSVFLPDNVKVFFGSGNDLAIYHVDDSGGQSIISETGTGNLQLRGTDIQLRNADGSKIYLEATNALGVDIRHNNSTKFETIGAGVSVYGQLNVASLNGGASGLSSHFGSLRYGNESGSAPYSTRRSLDLINTDSGNINYYINANDLSNTGNFHWHKGFNNAQLMTLTGIGGSLGIGITLPTHKLHVQGDAKISAGATFGGDIFIAGDVSLTGSIEGNVTGNLTGNLTGNVNAASGISTFTNVSAGIVTVTSIKTDKVGVNVNAGSNPVEINSGNNRVFVSATGNLGIRTDDTFGNSLFNTGATVSSIVGVGTTLAKSAVDFADAGKDITGAFANKMFMLPPKITTDQRGNLTGVTDGALIYNTDGNQLQVYISGGWVGIGTTTRVDS